MGGDVMSCALNVFFDRMTPKFPTLFHGRDADNDLLINLKDTWLLIEVVLDDAEDKQNEDKHVKQWLREIKRTVYHAEDLMDEINTEALHLAIESGDGSLTGSVSHLSDEFLNVIIPKIQQVVSTLEHFSAQINVLGLGGGATKKVNSYKQPSTSLVDELDLYGRDNEKEKLVAMVLSDYTDGNNINVIPIVGMGGIGKTTMAQSIYGDERVIIHFEKRAWVCVSDNYDAFKITKTLVDELLYLDSGRRDDFNRLQVMLKGLLLGKKILIVLDDVWNDNYNDWDKLIAPLLFGKQGSKIIVTTRNEKVAFMVTSGLPVQHLKPLSDEDCWSLFKKHAFDKGYPRLPPQLEKISKDIVKKCKELPLAVMMLGGLLRSKTEIREWEDILTNQLLMTSDNNEIDVSPILRLSYRHLPLHLKHCFGFCALFPKNYQLEEEELILLWMANDLVQYSTQNDKTLEDTGREYINELRSRSLLLKVSDGKYIMHDLVIDLARCVSDNFFVTSENYYPPEEVSGEARHFSYKSELYNAYERFKFLGQVKSLRTFYQLSLSSSSYPKKITKMFISDILPRLRCLRVLSLNGYDIKEVPNSVCNLKHLRYINLSRTFINQLPDGICSMHNLQTLKLSFCKNLYELPLELTKLVNLRHLELIETDLWEMPSHMGRLKSLQTLSCFIVDTSVGRGIEELENLHLHGYLIIKGLECVINSNDALKANLKNKKDLEDLVLEWSEDTNDSELDRDILDKLQPHTSLKNLTIEGYGGTSFPDWVEHDSYCNIVSLSLTNCDCFSLPGLGRLLSLKSLTITGLVNVTNVGQEFYGDVSFTKPFHSLMTLRIGQMREWEKWDTSGNVDFSRLEELYIEDCPKLIGKLPSQLLCLTNFEISRCPQLVFPDDWMSLSDDNLVNDQFHLSSVQFLSISEMPNLKELPGRFLGLGGLKEVRVKRCHNLITVPNPMKSINKMIVENCPSLVSLPTNIKELVVINCTKFKFPRGETNENCDTSLDISLIRVKYDGDSFNDIAVGLYPKLLSLDIYSCESLEVFPTIQNLSFLRELKFWGCNNLLSFPKGGLAAPNLDFFEIQHCKKLKSLPEHMHSLNPSLRKLIIMNCPEIESFPEGALPFCLETLFLIGCEKLINCRRNWALHKLPALRSFSIFGGDNEESFPEESLLPCSLEILIIGDRKKMKRLNEKGLLRLTSLTTLEIFNCTELMLHEEGLTLPTSLSVLKVRYSPLLKAQLERERGKYWPYIAHIHNIEINDELIS